MRGTTKWVALLAAWTFLTTGLAFGQDGAGQGTLGYATPSTIFPIPNYSTRPEAGGFYAAADFLFYRQTNPLKDQQVAVRGFVTTRDNVLEVPNSTGVFVPGSQGLALDVHQVTGPISYQPGFGVELGWKFADGQAVTFGWKYLTEAKYSAVATLFPKNYQLDQNFQNTYLTANVFNFPSDFNGPIDDVRSIDGNFVFNGAAGIWNAADIMTLSFVQRYQDWFITFRQPVFETECYRMNGLMGPRITWIWERFQWRTTDLDALGQGGPQDVAIYSNVVSNYMYGAFIGTEQEFWLGQGFTAMLDLRATGYIDVVKTRVRYELGTKHIGAANKGAKRDFFFVPELEASPGIMWYPIEGVQVKLGYDVFAFFNTRSSPRPVSFDYSGLDPGFERTFRIFDGFQFNVSISF